MTQTVDFKVIGEQTIHCAGCEQRIGNALRRLDGVQEVSASAQTQQVKVALDASQVSPETVQERLELMGYETTQRGTEWALARVRDTRQAVQGRDRQRGR